MIYSILSQNELDEFHKNQRDLAKKYCENIGKSCEGCMNESCPVRVKEKQCIP